jgi:hypothetical protein
MVNVDVLGGSLRQICYVDLSLPWNQGDAGTIRLQAMASSFYADARAYAGAADLTEQDLALQTWLAAQGRLHFEMAWERRGLVETKATCPIV